MGATYVVEDDKGLSPAAIVVADSVEDTVAGKGGYELLKKQDEENQADGSEVEVVDEEQSLELEGLAATHPSTTSEDEVVVADDEDGGRLESGHWGL